jgi:hypothetical protein
VNNIIDLTAARKARTPILEVFVRVLELIDGVPPFEVDSFELNGSTDYLARNLDRFVDGKTQFYLSGSKIELIKKANDTSIMITSNKPDLMLELYGKIKRRWL